MHNLEVIVETGARYILDPRRKHRPNLLEPDESKMVRLRYLQRMLEWCEFLNSSVLSFWSGELPSSQTAAGARDCFLQAIDNLSNLASDKVRLAIEPEPGHFIAKLSDYDKLKPQLPHNVGLCLDVGHLLANDIYSPAEAIKKYADDIVAVQLDDMRRNEHIHLAPGEGDLDWPATVAACEKYLSAETTACFELSRDGHRFHQLAPRCIELYNSLC